jgi:hypothetical protein
MLYGTAAIVYYGVGAILLYGGGAIVVYAAMTAILYVATGCILYGGPAADLLVDGRAFLERGYASSVGAGSAGMQRCKGLCIGPRN